MLNQQERIKMKKYLQAIGAVMEDPQWDTGTLKITCGDDGVYTLYLYGGRDLLVKVSGNTVEGVLVDAGTKVLELIED